ncbi:hypothetical protein EVAR_97179_1 [Eumeta japonica]|uniref:Uncharacterized protein n=1 Tax=Eumeta variegata TaxID=151549 RepID=A0A4C1WIK7_EUMVA|nr:hypothetical protein EVAR_97179_1 [Eumeta japonica]
MGRRDRKRGSRWPAPRHLISPPSITPSINPLSIRCCTIPLEDGNSLLTPPRCLPVRKPITFWIMKLGAPSPRSLRKAGLCAYSRLERMAESRATSVQTSSPGGPHSPRIRQRTTIGFRSRTRTR